MDLAFGIEALALAWLALATRPSNPAGKLAGGKLGDGKLGDGKLAPGNLAPGVHEVPEDIDAEAARLVLATMGTSIDTLTPAQLSYRESWRIGS
jgi:S-adenosylhomocysteine hydrolase